MASLGMTSLEATSLEAMFGDTLNSAIQPLLSQITPQTEVEFRLGTFQGEKKGFHATQSLIQFQNLVEHLRAQTHLYQKTETTTLDIQMSEIPNVRVTLKDLETIKRYCHDESVAHIDPTNLLYVTKVKGRDMEHDQTVDFQDYGLRFQLSEEIPTEAEMYHNIMNHIASTSVNKYFRYKHRYTFQNNALQFDLTVVKSASGTSFRTSNVLRKPEEYEAEVEIKHNNEHQLESLDNQIVDSLYQWISWAQNSFAVTRLTESQEILGEYTQLVFHEDPQVTHLNRYFIGMDVLPLTRDKLSTITTGYSVTDKADGERCLMFISNRRKGNIYLINNRMEIKHTGLMINDELLSGTLLDGELVTTFSGGHCYLIFDCLFAHSNDCRQLPLLDSSQSELKPIPCSEEQPMPAQPTRLQEIAFMLNRWLPQPIIRHSDLQVRAKTYVYQTPTSSTMTIFQLAKQVIQATYEYNRDGLIFTKIGDTYPKASLTKPIRWTTILKWKDLDQLSIDFLVEIIDKHPNLVTKGQRYVQAQLKVSERKTQRLVNFVPRQHPEGPNFHIIKLKIWDDDVPYARDGNAIYSQSVIEFIYDASQEAGFEWIPLRFRPDKTQKSKPNAFDTADSNWSMIREPITRDLITGAVYYSLEGTEKKSLIEPMTTFHNSVKYELFDRVAPKRGHADLLDVACGQGGDLPKWSKSQIAYVLGIDIDQQNIVNSKARYDVIAAKYQHPYPSKTDFVWGNSVLPLNTGEAGRDNANQTRLQEILGHRGQDSFDLVSCQFALHYFMESEAAIRGLLSNVSRNLKNGGYWIGTTLDGDNVFQLLKDGQPHGGKIDQQKIWELIPKYQEATMSNYGQRIAAFNLSIGTNDEFLVNFRYLTEIAETYGLKKIEIASFETLFEKVIKTTSPERRQIIEKMSPDEKKYSFMNRYFIFQKVSGSIVVPQISRPQISITRKTSQPLPVQPLPVPAQPLPPQQVTPAPTKVIKILRKTIPAPAPTVPLPPPTMITIPPQPIPAPLPTIVVPVPVPVTVLQQTTTGKKPRCQCLTAKKVQCSRPAMTGALYCAIHKDCANKIK